MAKTVGTGKDSEIRAYELNAQGNKLEELFFPKVGIESLPQMVVDSANSYYDNSRNIRWYAFPTQNQLSYVEYCSYKYALTLTDGNVGARNLATHHMAYVMDAKPGSPPVDTYTEQYGKEITATEYDAAFARSAKVG